MRKSRFSEEQIIGVRKTVEPGRKVSDVCREQGIAESTYLRWTARYGALDVSEARRLRELEDPCSGRRNLRGGIDAANRLAL